MWVGSRSVICQKYNVVSNSWNLPGYMANHCHSVSLPMSLLTWQFLSYTRIPEVFVYEIQLSSTNSIAAQHIHYWALCGHAVSMMLFSLFKFPNPANAIHNYLEPIHQSSFPPNFPAIWYMLSIQHFPHISQMNYSTTTYLTRLNGVSNARVTLTIHSKVWCSQFVFLDLLGKMNRRSVRDLTTWNCRPF